jgi:peptidoglycan hydrolase-like protein with peptidoglycan-binding domain
LIEAVFADEQVRKAQEELYKRHLYYGDITGEVSPALTTAITAYQQKKGFSPSGRLDLETCASLGLMKAPVKTVRIDPPFVFMESGDLWGANGEALPNSTLAYRSSDDPFIQITNSAANAQEVALATAGAETASQIKTPPARTPRSHVRSRRIQPRKETNPLALAFHTVDHALKLLVGDTQPRKKRAVGSRF